MGDTACMFVTFIFKIHQKLPLRNNFVEENFNPKVIRDGLIYRIVSILHLETMSPSQ